MGVRQAVEQRPQAKRAIVRPAPRWLGYAFLVCSAGIASSAPITETTVELWERNYAVLARGYFLASRAGFQLLREQGTGGSIVFVGSKNALVGGANAAAYSSAKAAELHLARCLAYRAASLTR